MLMSTIPAANREELESYGTPRGWETVSMFTNLHERTTQKAALADGVSSTSNTKPKAIPEDLAHGIYAAVGFMEGKAYIEHFNEQMVVPYPWEVAQSASSIRIPTSAIARAELTEDLAKHFIESGAQSREALLLYMNRNDSEDRALFCTLIGQALGQTASDIALIEDINKRLMVVSAIPLQMQDDGTSIVQSTHLDGNPIAPF
jgi:hypothetical protein